MGYIFILLSIKTRIETVYPLNSFTVLLLFLSYYPLKQGLKQPPPQAKHENTLHFYPTIH